MENIGSVIRGKKVYGKPMLMSEEFVPNEYVAICFKLPCDDDAADAYEKSINNTPSGGHQDISGTCGHEDAQVIQVSNGMVTGAFEQNRYLGKLNITFTDSGYQTTKTYPFQVQGGDKLYWVTEGGGSTYHHQGTVDLTDNNKTVNHS